MKGFFNENLSRIFYGQPNATAGSPDSGPIIAVDRYGRQLGVSYLVDADGNPITSTLVGADQALDVNVVQTVGGGSGGGPDPVGLKNVAATTINPATEDTLATVEANTQQVSNAATIVGGVTASRAIQFSGTDGSNVRLFRLDSDGHPQVDVLSSALPTGAATEATLASIDGSNATIEADLASLESKVATATNQNTQTVLLNTIDTGVGQVVTNTSPPSAVTAGAKTVTVAGTAEALVASATPCKKIIMTAEADNSGNIYYGGATVSSTLGDFLFPAQKIEIEIDDVQKIFIDADTGTDGVKFTYFT